MGHFPFFMEIAGKKGVVVGGGKVASRKVEKLLAFGPALTVIAPRMEECMRIQEKRLRKDAAASLLLEERAFRIEDLDGADFVIAATDDETLNGRIADRCRQERILVNVADDREKCTFFFPALVKDGSLTVGISTDGKSPAAASWARKEISRMLPKAFGDIVDLLGQMRPLVMEMGVEESERKRIMEEMFLYCMENDGKVMPEELAKRFIGEYGV